MFTLRMLYKRAGPLGKVFLLALLLFVFVTTIIRVHKAVNAIQERNSSVHTHSSPR